MSESGIFKAAVKLRGDQRAKFLDQACGTNDELRREVELLLQAHENSEGFLEPSQAVVATIERPTERPGLQIGRYRLLEQIGEGGMGTVWVAEQTEPVRRRVALKLIKPGMDSRQVLSRFEAERQALALMDHPNIAKVYDGGMTAEGRPYFVMEYVKGVPITKYCDSARLPIDQRLKLFVTVCQAVQHAHQKGVIHRDLKPSNILVCLYDGQPVPKVIDFGLAKAINQPLTEHTLYTAHGLMVGTPLYMSPEQAEFNNLDIDTRSDIYSLGVILYELLTGTTPLERHQLKDAAVQEILRLIKEVEPLKPSSKLSSSASLPNIAAQRSLEPAQLNRLVQGDLDWIVMKALEKERSRRYETANGLARDVDRHLHDEPVEARPPSISYRLRKFIRRQKTAVAASLAIAMAVLLGLFGTSWQAIRATTAERDQTAQRDRANLKAIEANANAKKAIEQKDRADLATIEAKEKLYKSLLAEAKVSRFSQRIGQRFNTLKAVREATELARELKKPPEEFDEPRRLAIAALALPDLQPTELWVSEPDEADWTTLYYNDFDPSFKRIAITSSRGAVSIRRVGKNANDSGEIARLPGAGNEVILRWSPDGRFLAVRHLESYRLQVWDLERAEARLMLDIPSNRGMVDFSPDAKQLVTVVQGRLSVYDLANGKVAKVFGVGDKTAWDVAHHPTLARVALNGSNGISVVDLMSGEQLQEMLLSQLPGMASQQRVEHVAWHPNGELIAASTAGYVYVYHTALKRLLWRGEHRGAGSSLSFDPTGEWLASSDWHEGVKFWDSNTGRLILSTGDRTSGYPRFGPNGLFARIFLEPGKRSTGRIAQIESAHAYRTLSADVGRKNNWAYYNCSLHPNGRLLAIGTLQGLSFKDAATGRDCGFVPLGTGSVMFEPSGSMLIATSTAVFRWPVGDNSTGNEIKLGPPERIPFSIAQGWINFKSLVSTADGKVLARSNFDGAIVWHHDRPSEAIRLRPHDHCRSVSISPDADLVATGSHEGIKVWNANTGRLVQDFPTTHYWTMPCFSPDGQWLVNNDGRKWRVSDWSVVPEHMSEHRVAFAPEMALAAWGGHKGFIPLVDYSTGCELARLEDPEQDVLLFLEFSSDGTKLMGVSDESACVRIWDLRRIREGLQELGLDWEAPPYITVEAHESDKRQLSVTIRGAESLTKQGVAKSDQTNELIAAYRKVIELDPTNGMVYHNLGVALERNALTDQAIEAYRKATEFSPRLSNAHNNLAFLLASQGKIADAIIEYERAIDISPNYAVAHRNLGSALRSLGRLDEALEHCAKAVGLQHDDPVAHYQLGLTLNSQHKYAGALAEFKKSHDLGLKQPSWNYPTARLINEAKRSVGLENKLPAILNGDVEPVDAVERADLGHICVGKKRFALAARFFRDAFHADRHLADQYPRRYNAACAAVLAASGQDQDEPPQSEADRADWRKQAFEWLRADLAVQIRTLETDSAQTRASTRTRLARWLNDPDLASVRDPYSLSQLPEDERKTWQDLWDEVNKKFADPTVPKS